MTEMEASQRVPGKPACYAVADCLYRKIGLVPQGNPEKSDDVAPSAVQQWMSRLGQDPRNGESLAWKLGCAVAPNRPAARVRKMQGRRPC